jgi:hypothetical protein
MRQQTIEKEKEKATQNQRMIRRKSWKQDFQSNDMWVDLILHFESFFRMHLGSFWMLELYWKSQMFI